MFTAASLVCFGLFALLVDFGLLRTPFHVRAGEAVVLPGIVLGLLVGALWRMSAVQPPMGPMACSRWRVALVLLVTTSLAVAGQSGERVSWVAGGWTSLESSRGAREEVSERLWSNPPIEYWRNRNPEMTLRLAGVCTGVCGSRRSDSGPVVRAGDLLLFESSDGRTPRVLSAGVAGR